MTKEQLQALGYNEAAMEKILEIIEEATQHG